MITAVIFDMDGVIADSEYFNVKAKHLILKKAGIEVDWHYHDKFLGTTHEFMWTEMKKEFESLDKEVPYYIDQWVKTRKELIATAGPSHVHIPPANRSGAANFWCRRMYLS